MSIGAVQAGASGGAPAPDNAARAESARQPKPASSPTELTPEALALIGKLKARDSAVRQHEQAHLAAAGGLALSGASYTYQRGPNGVDYAVGGEVQIDTSPGNTPQETIARAQRIAAAALAPADPSGPDRAVAAQAQQMAQQAATELALEQAGAALTAPSSTQQKQAVDHAYGAVQTPAHRIDIHA